MHCPNCGHEWSWGEAPPIHIEVDGRALFEIIRERQAELNPGLLARLRRWLRRGP